MDQLSKKISSEARACTICAAHLPLGPRPVFQIDPAARILIAGQAPGTKVHASGRPFTDLSGDRLRSWLGVTAEQFYDPAKFAILPMGFCYPGTGKSGDLPPRPECAATWRKPMLVLPHPSGRNNGWLAKNPWFEKNVIPKLQTKVSSLL